MAAPGVADPADVRVPGAGPGPVASPWPYRAALGLMLASGFAGLGYQIVWAQQSALWLGHEAAAVLAVVTAFFGGLALGAVALGRRIERSVQPQRWYAACEAAIAVWGVALAVLLEPVSGGMLRLIGAEPTPLWQWSVAFIGAFTLLLPATAAMGATLPALERVTSRWRGEGRSIGALYAGNTAGAVLGVLVTAFWWVPAFGLWRTALACAALNLACAGVALCFGSTRIGREKDAALAAPERLAVTATATATEKASATERAPVAPIVAGTREAWRHGLPLFFTGLLGIGYEVLVVRVLSQVAEDTVYTFAILLAVYLVGSAIGAAVWQRWLFRRGDADAWRGRLLGLLALSCLLGSASLWGAETLRDTIAPGGNSVRGMGAALAAEAALGLAAFALPTFFMGALFSHLCVQARAAGIGLGHSLGLNTLGAALAPVLFGVVLVPALGSKFTLLLVCAGYLVLGLRQGAMRPLSWVPALGVASAALWAPPLAFVEVSAGGRIVSYREGVMAAVSVVEDREGVARLRINNRQQEGSSATLVADARQALLPLLLHPAPARALFLGLGTGVTARAAAREPGLRVDAVELLPEVIDASKHFADAADAAGGAGGAGDFGNGGDLRAAGDAVPGARLRVVAADARRFVRNPGPKYEVIVSDNFHPARSGSGALYTVEHFRAVRARLAPDGVFCQWLPLHQLDLQTLRSIVASFVAVYPGASAMLATNSLQTPVIGLVARADGRRFALSAVRARLAAARDPGRDGGRDIGAGLTRFGIADEFAALGGFVAGPAGLARFAGAAPLNTDDRPVVSYLAPRITYAPDSAPGDRLLDLLGELSLAPDEVIDPGADAGWLPRMAAYWAARDQFVAAGRGVTPSGDAAAMLAQVREPLLSVLRTSADFRPAYEPLLRLASALARTDDTAARALLQQLIQLQPARPEATRALQALPGG